LGGRWGFVDRRGRLVVKVMYDEVRSFSEGMAAVRLGCLWGYVNDKGVTCVPHKYAYANDYLDGLARVGGWVYINAEGGTVWSPEAASR